MRNSLVVIAAAVSITAVAATAAPPHHPTPAAHKAAPLRLVDLTGEFDRFATSTKDMDDATRVAAFEKQIGPLGEGFYARSRHPDGYDQRIAKHLHNYPGMRDGIMRVSHDFNAMFATARADFEKNFGTLSSDEPIYLVDSMGEMDGGTRTLNGKNILFFGADVTSKIHNDKDMKPFFEHELFHLYHEKKMADCNAVWCSMWEEGLATYVASKLNPKAGDAALMLDTPAPVRPPVDADPKAAFCAAQPLLQSDEQKKYASLFYGDSHLPNYPSRMGYYLGYMIARDLGRTRSLRQLADLTGPKLETAFMAAYARHAGKCGATA